MILCGGGSGVTPMMSMVGELLHMKFNGQLNHVQSVHLIWVASNVDPIRDWFPAQLRQVRDAVRTLESASSIDIHSHNFNFAFSSQGAPFELHLHDTGSRQSSGSDLPVLFKAKKKDKYGSNYTQLPGVAAGQAYTPVDDIARLPIIRGMHAEFLAKQFSNLNI
jgi:hypothetical protein